METDIKLRTTIIPGAAPKLNTTIPGAAANLNTTIPGAAPNYLLACKKQPALLFLERYESEDSTFAPPLPCLHLLLLHRFQDRKLAGLAIFSLN